VGEEGMVEIKCPFYTRRHGGRLHKAVPGHYWLQVNALLEITGRKWCDYVCWAPEGMCVYRIHADPQSFQYLARSQDRAVVIEAFERLLLPGASVERVARSFSPPLVFDRSYASREADRARSAELSRLAAFSAAGGSLRLMCWCAPRQCHAASIARAVASLAEEELSREP